MAFSKNDDSFDPYEHVGKVLFGTKGDSGNKITITNGTNNISLGALNADNAVDFEIFGFPFQASRMYVDFLLTHIPLIELHGYSYWKSLCKQPALNERLHIDVIIEMNRLISIHFFKNNIENG